MCLAILDKEGSSRSALLHMWHRIFGDRKHLQNVASEGALYLVEVDLGDIWTHDLLGGVIDKDVNLAKLVDMLLDRLTAGLVVHKIAWNKQALLALGLHHLLRLLGVFLLLRQEDDADI